MVDSQHEFMLLVRQQPRRNSLFRVGASRTCGGEGTLVRVLNEGDPWRRCAASEDAWSGNTGAGTTAIASVAIEHGRYRIDVGRVERVIAIVPILAAERTDSQVQLHNVVELAIAAEYFPFAVFQRIPCRSQTRSNFVTPSKLNGLT